MKIEMNNAFWAIVKKATFLACFIDWDHQNQNFMVSITAVGISL